MVDKSVDDGDTCGNKRAGEPSPNVAQEELRKGEPVGRAVNCSASELSIYLRGLEERFLPTFYSDTSQSAQSKSMSIASRSYQRGKKTVVFHGFPSLQMSRNLTAGLGEAVLTWFLAGFPVRTSAQQEKGQESPVGNPVSGPNLLASFARFDRDTCSWKIPQCSLLGDWEQFSETWPQWGMWDGGACWELPTLVPRISGNGSGLWQTPVADDAVNRVQGKINSRGEPKLSAQVLLPTPTANPYGSCQGGSAGRDGQTNRPSLNTMAAKNLWPTPRANDGEKRGNFDVTNPRNGLPAAAKRFPTPTARDWKSGKASQKTMERNSRPLSEYIGDQLNPDWVEFLMGWPIGWTDLDSIKPATVDWDQGEPLGVPRASTDTPNRKHRLMCLGNGQVPQCAAKAWRILSA